MTQRLDYEEAQNLWQEFRGGDIRALGKVMEGYYADLYNWGQRFNHDQDVVKDCIQETFLTLWKKHDTIRSVENVRAYLMVMLKRRILAEKNKQIGAVDIDRLDGYEFLVEFAPDLRLIEEEHEVYQIKKAFSPHQSFAEQAEGGYLPTILPESEFRADRRDHATGQTVGIQLISQIFKKFAGRLGLWLAVVAFMVLTLMPD